MAILVKPRTEGVHWYTAMGEPVHTRPNADGKGEHATTLVDARKLHLFASVTNKLSILAKHGLDKWRMRKVQEMMNQTSQNPNESKSDFFARVINLSFEQVDVAASGGTGIHQAILGALQGRPVDPEYRPYIDRIFEFFDRHKITCQTSERTLVNHEEGFAGTMDFAGFRDGVPLVLDWKTRRTVPGEPIISYEGQPMQVAAYGATYWTTQWPAVLGGNIYISSTEPGRIEMIPYDMTRMFAEWETFKHVCALWRHFKGYDVRVAGSAAEVTGPEIPKERYQNIVISGPDPTMKPVTSLAAPASREGKNSDLPPSAQTEIPRKASRRLGVKALPPVEALLPPKGQPLTAKWLSQTKGAGTRDNIGKLRNMKRWSTEERRIINEGWIAVSNKRTAGHISGQKHAKKMAAKHAKSKSR